MSIELGISIAVLCAIPGIRNAFLRLLTAEHEVASRRLAIQREALAASAALRSAARWSLKQKRDRDQALSRAQNLGPEIAKLRSLTEEIKNRPMETKWILEGSMRQLFGRFAFKVSSPEPVRSFGRSFLPAWAEISWKNGRTIIVGAVSATDARRRIEARFPEKNGFFIQSL